MILAHLRGLLEPGYPQGLRSIARERMILRALALEQDARTLETRLQTDSLLLGPSLAHHNAPQQILQELTHDIRRLAGYRELDSALDSLPSITDGGEALIKLYETLTESGLLEPDLDDL